MQVETRPQASSISVDGTRTVPEDETPARLAIATTPRKESMNWRPLKFGVLAVAGLRTFYVLLEKQPAKSLKNWCTRQDSNLWPLPSEPVQIRYARLRNSTLNYCY